MVDFNKKLLELREKKKTNLQTRMHVAVSGAKPTLKPNFNPPPAPPPKKEEEEIPEIKDLIKSAADRLKVKRLTDKIAAFNQAESAAKKAKKPLVEQLKDLLGENHVAKALCGEYKINYFNAPRRTLDINLLMANGVEKEVIDASYRMKDAYTLKITSLAGDDEDEE